MDMEFVQEPFEECFIPETMGHPAAAIKFELEEQDHSTGDHEIVENGMEENATEPQEEFLFSEIDVDPVKLEIEQDLEMLAEHENSHQSNDAPSIREGKNFKCEQCGISYSHPEMLSWHTDNCHGSNPTVKVTSLGDKKFSLQCVQCKQKFRDIYIIIKHLHIQHQHDNLPFCCNLCSLRFLSNHNLRRHQLKCQRDQSAMNPEEDHGRDAREARRKSLYCTLCDSTFTHREILAWHTENFHGPKPTVRVDDTNKCLQCVFCDETSKDMHFIIRHLHLQHQLENLPFRCTICGKQFTDPTRLKRHKHTCVSPVLRCEECNVTYSHPEMLAWHANNCHGPKPTVKVVKIGGKGCDYRCTLCDETNRDIYAIIRHLNARHQLENLPFSCHVCSQKFAKSYEQKRHQVKCMKKRSRQRAQCIKNVEHSKTESKLGPETERGTSKGAVQPTSSGEWIIGALKCDTCVITYAHPEMLLWHNRYCHGPDAKVRVIKLSDKKCDFQCVSCGQKFKDLSWSIQHLRSQHQFRNLPFHCNLCGKQFITWYGVKRHKIVCRKGNSSLKHQVCEHCNITFSYPEMLAWHTKNCHGPDSTIKMVNGDRRYQCIECKSKFKDLYVVVKHLRSQHQLEDLPFCCNICNRQFFGWPGLRKHKLKCRKRKSSSRKVDDIGNDVQPLEEILSPDQHSEQPENQEIDLDVDDIGNDVQPLEEILSPEQHSVQPEDHDIDSDFDDIGNDVQPLEETMDSEQYSVQPEDQEIDSDVDDIGNDVQPLEETMDSEQHSVQPEDLPRHSRDGTNDRSNLNGLTCSECNILYTHPEMLAWHIENCHGSSPTIKVIKLKGKMKCFQCLSCEKKLREFHIMIRHLVAEHHLKNLPYSCQSCDKQFTEKNRLKDHKRTCQVHVDSSSLRCAQCNITYSNPEMLSWHTTNCHGVNPTVKVIKHGDKRNFQCLACKTMYKELSLMVQHLYSEHKLKNLPFHCSICNRQFQKQYKLKKHIQSKCKVVQSLTKQFRCMQCDIVYAHPQMLSWHEKNCHGPNATIKVIKLGFQCIECKTKFRDLYKAVHHLRSLHGLENLPFSCHVCNRQFMQWSALKKHCLKCKTVNSDDDVLEETTEQHPIQREHQLDCLHGPSRGVTRNAAATRPPGQKCGECFASYNYPEILAWHSTHCHGVNAKVEVITMDNRERQYRCRACGTVCHLLSVMIQHLQHLHGLRDLPYHCTVCDTHFVKKFSLARHRLTCHAQPLFEQVLLPDSIKLEPPLIRDVKLPLDSSLPKCQVLVTKLLQCDSCSFFTDKKLELATHMQTHQEPSTSAGTGFRDQPGNFRTATSVVLKCHECGLSYPYPELLKWHAENCHGTNALVKVKTSENQHFYQCACCKHVYNKIQVVIRHLRSRHQLSNLPFHCNFCDKQFIYWCDLNSHQLECKIRQNANRSANSAKKSANSTDRSANSADRSAKPSNRSANSTNRSDSSAKRSANSTNRSANSADRSAKPSNRSANSTNRSDSSAKRNANSTNRSANPANRSANSTNRSDSSADRSANSANRSDSSADRSANFANRSDSSADRSAKPANRSANSVHPNAEFDLLLMVARETALLDVL